MPNYGDNDPHWSRAFTKLSQLIEHQPARRMIQLMFSTLWLMSPLYFICPLSLTQ